jgi:hypothetical protein
LSVQERYPTFAKYQSQVRRALDRMVRQRLFLCEDADAEQKRLYANGVALGVPAPQAGVPAPTPLPHCADRQDRSDDDEGDDGDHVGRR